MPVELDEDVLYIILGLCSRSTLLTLCQVSRTIGKHALPHLVRKVSLQSSPQVIGFSNLVIGSAFNLGAHVLELELIEEFADGELFRNYSKENQVSTWGPLIIQAFKLMSNLQSFEIYCNTFGLFNYSPLFVQTLHDLPHLKSLSIFDIEPDIDRSLGDAIGACSGLTSPNLQRLEVVRYKYNSDFERPSKLVLDPNRGLGWLLSRNKLYLKELELRQVDMNIFLDEGEPLRDRNSESRVIFSAVTQLHISWCLLSLDGLMAGFPALRTLHVFHDNFISIHNPQHLQKNISLPNLVSISGNYDTICSVLQFNTSRSVRRVVVDDYLAHMRLFKMTLGIKCLLFEKETLAPLSWWKRLAETIPQLTYIGLWANCETDQDQDFLCNHIPKAISSLPLTFIFLCIEEGRRAFGKTVAQSFAKAIPTLKYIHVQMRTLGTPITIGDSQIYTETSSWKVVPKVGDTLVSGVEQIDSEVGEALSDYYEFQVYDSA